MADKLAKLDDLKFALNAGTTGIDDELTGLLLEATAMFERESGLTPGDMVRRVDRVAYPDGGGDPRTSARLVHLDARPVESITEVVQLYAPSTAAEFDTAATNGVGVLAADTEYILESADLGRLARVNGFWSMGPRHLRVTFTAGWADPDDTDAIGAGGVVPPAQVQRAVVAQATQLFNTRKTPGLAAVKGSSKATGGGGLGVKEPGVHPLLKTAAEGYRSKSR